MYRIAHECAELLENCQKRITRNSTPRGWRISRVFWRNTQYNCKYHLVLGPTVHGSCICNKTTSEASHNSLQPSDAQYRCANCTGTHARFCRSFPPPSRLFALPLEWISSSFLSLFIILPVKGDHWTPWDIWRAFTVRLLSLQLGSSAVPTLVCSDLVCFLVFLACISHATVRPLGST